MDIKNTLIQQAKKHPHKTAIIFEGRSITFTQLKDESFKVANYLLGQGLKASDKIGLFLPNTPEAVFCILGAFSAAATIIPMDIMLTEAELVTFLNHSEAKMLLAYPKKDIDFQNLKQHCPLLEKIIIMNKAAEGFDSFNEIMASASSNEPQVEAAPDALSSIFYTSGSSGHPKGVMLSFSHLTNPPETINHFLGVTDKDVFLCGGVPFSHIGGLDFILVTLKYAPTLILMARFNPLEFLRNIQEHKVTIFCIVPAMYIAIVSLKEYDKFDLSTLRYAVVFGAPSSPLLLRKFHATCPQACVLNGWGMTETAAPNTYSPPDETKLESIGKFNYNLQARIVDDAGFEVPQGQKGELWVRGEPVMVGYYKEPGLTDEVLTEDGWLKTGDIAFRDRDGLYYIVGRKKDMIKVAGEIVFSAEVEESIQRHPKVKEVAVVGVSDKLRGEVPKAFITVHEGESLDEQELKAFLKEQLAHFKIPHYVEIVDNLPKNRTGKIDKTKLSL